MQNGGVSSPRQDPSGQVGVSKIDITRTGTNHCIDFITPDTSKLGECEFFLISEMNSQLIVHHPYRTLLDLQGTLSLTQEETTLAWSVINDHYFTDLPLLYPPHVIAITAIFLGI